ncbi:MAG: hypothetical protein L6R40_005642 [Gallowayella cf. fulva]|nr:MAG: hypothetical protein L6R40_005642 [Xanthomendoza cf. fulva]
MSTKPFDLTNRYLVVLCGSLGLEGPISNAPRPRQMVWPRRAVFPNGPAENFAPFTLLNAARGAAVAFFDPI